MTTGVLLFMFQPLGDLEKVPGSGTSAGKRSNLPKFRKVSPPTFQQSRPLCILDKKAIGLVLDQFLSQGFESKH